MRAVIQRVSKAKVQVNNEVLGRIEKGLLVYLSVAENDTEADAKFIAEKLANLRIFEDENGKMNLGLLDVAGQMMIVSNFTLHGDCRRGRRPGFDAAAGPEIAKKLYEHTIGLIEQQGVTVTAGKFGGHMYIDSTNDGPVTFLLDSSRLF